MDTAKYVDLLFKFEGRIGPNTLLQGTVLVFLAALALQVLGLVIPGIGILGLALFYPLFCLYAKRLHDGGYAAVWTIAVLGGIFVAALVIGMILTPILIGDAVAAAFRGEVTSGVSYMFKAFLMGLLINALTYFGAAFIVNGIVKRSDGENSYGSAPEDASGINPF